ncbi:MAG: cytochrome c oxidase subunit II transmembrane domain-containing protein [Candidatus Hodgkinia cicadicola]
MYVGAPSDWQVGLQKAATPVMLKTVQLMHHTNALLLLVIIIVSLAIVCLCFKYGLETVGCCTQSKWMKVSCLR